MPSLADLIRSGGCECSVSEVRRMEKLILEKFNWDLTRTTALDFLHLVSAPFTPLPADAFSAAIP